ncbi:hypothetical protein OBBRIDRAFT_886528 [Obba rivulosa]|uniref:C2H2-type domain-containing protein n=1 Tax=Obba rivulosa TaxID=1052685 RepID=A0A8E2DM04_9APHY|nr:hypothetical protein OBBRIDRAFT_886528 [Obba rivulosa]
MEGFNPNTRSVFDRYRALAVEMLTRFTGVSNSFDSSSSDFHPSHYVPPSAISSPSPSPSSSDFALASASVAPPLASSWGSSPYTSPSPTFSPPALSYASSPSVSPSSSPRWSPPSPAQAFRPHSPFAYAQQPESSHTLVEEDIKELSYDEVFHEALFVDLCDDSLPTHPQFSSSSAYPSPAHPPLAFPPSFAPPSFSNASLAEPLPAHPLHAHTYHRHSYSSSYAVHSYSYDGATEVPSPIPERTTSTQDEGAGRDTSPTIDPAAAFPPVAQSWHNRDTSPIPSSSTAGDEPIALGSSRRDATPPPMAAGAGQEVQCEGSSGAPATTKRKSSEGKARGGRKKRSSVSAAAVAPDAGRVKQGAKKGTRKPVKGEKYHCRCGAPPMGFDRRTITRHKTTDRHLKAVRKPLRRLFQCPHCDSQFSRADPLERHLLARLRHFAKTGLFECPPPNVKDGTFIYDYEFDDYQSEFSDESDMDDSD